MKTLLITGGAVHGKLDDVKIITNHFKGRMMANIAKQLASYFKIIYLTVKGNHIPSSQTGDWDTTLSHVKALGNERFRAEQNRMHQLGIIDHVDNISYENNQIVYHDGLYDYRDKVLAIAPKVDGILLGAAVANLIPQLPFPGKFPSHNYKPGDIINIPFVIAPRIIDMVKEVAPKARLFGFKLLSGVPLPELVKAAYGVLMESHADFVVANDAKSLEQKFIVTKEKSTIPLNIKGLVDFIYEAMLDVSYETIMVPMIENVEIDALELYKTLMKQCKEEFQAHDGFGTVAVRLKNDFYSFITTTRTKLLEGEPEFVVVSVNDEKRQVICKGNKKATLNAPLLAHLFRMNPNVKSIVHIHKQIPEFVTLPYAPPATVRDSLRNVYQSFNIEHHGCYLLKEK